MTITPLQRRLLTLLMLDPGARVGRLQTALTEAGWNPRVTTSGLTRSLSNLIGLRLVRRSAVPDLDIPAWRYSLTDRGLTEVVRPDRTRKVA